MSGVRKICNPNLQIKNSFLGSTQLFINATDTMAREGARDRWRKSEGNPVIITVNFSAVKAS